MSFALRQNACYVSEIRDRHIDMCILLKRAFTNDYWVSVK